MKFDNIMIRRNIFSGIIDPKPTTDLYLATYRVAKANLNNIVRSAKERADNIKKGQIGMAAFDVYFIIDSWAAEAQEAIENGTMPNRHTPIEKLANGDYITFDDVLYGFGVHYLEKDEEAMAPRRAKTIFIIDGEETTYSPTVTNDKWLVEALRVQGHDIRVKTPDGLILEYQDPQTPTANTEQTTNTAETRNGTILIDIKLHGNDYRTMAIENNGKTLALLGRETLNAFISSDEAKKSGEELMWHEVRKVLAAISVDGTQESVYYVPEAKNPTILSCRV